MPPPTEIGHVTEDAVQSPSCAGHLAVSTMAVRSIVAERGGLGHLGTEMELWATQWTN